MIGTQEKLGLTNTPLAANLYPLSQKTKAGIRTPNNIGQDIRPLNTVVFLCPIKTQSALCRVLSFMAGCIEQPLKRLAGSYAGSSNLIHSATQQFEHVAGGYPLYIGITA
jgi:hypothetical protein